MGSQVSSKVVEESDLYIIITETRDIYPENVLGFTASYSRDNYKANVLICHMKGRMCSAT